jgi:hypothetical protein
MRRLCDVPGAGLWGDDESCTRFAPLTGRGYWSSGYWDYIDRRLESDKGFRIQGSGFRSLINLKINKRGRMLL